MVKERTPDESSDTHELAARLNTAVVHLNRRMRRLDLELGLPTAQASALSLLASAGRHTIGALAHFELVAAPTMTRIVAALEERGLVTRLRTTEDLRIVHVEATAKGRALIRRGLSNRVQRLAASMSELSPGERETLTNATGILSRLARPSP